MKKQIQTEKNTYMVRLNMVISYRLSNFDIGGTLISVVLV